MTAVPVAFMVLAAVRVLLQLLGAKGRDDPSVLPAAAKGEAEPALGTCEAVS